MGKISLRQKIIGKAAEFMVDKKTSPPKIAPVKKDLAQSKLAFITTAGVHQVDQEAFNTKGDHTFRVIDGDIELDRLTITHTHYDISDAMEDINCVFPLDILRDFKEEGLIGEVSQRHFGLMGYIPDLDSLVKHTAPAIADMLVEDGVDIALLSPG